MAYKINPFHQLLWRTPDTLQIGVGPNRLVLEKLTPGQERLIDALYFGVATENLPVLANQIDVPLGEAKAIIESLQPALLAQDTSAFYGGRKTSQSDFPPSLNAREVPTPETIRAGLSTRHSGAEVIANRRAASVHLASLDATGLTMMLALAAAGVGTFTAKDSARVSQADAASNLYPRALLGHSRFWAARLILESSWPGSKLLTTNRPNDKKTARADLAVATNHQVTSPSEAALWRTMDVPVIEIRYQPDGAEVSPVLTGANGCLVCRDHRQQDEDPHHLAVASQLIDSKLRFDDGGSRLVATGLATSQILNYLDGRGLGLEAAEVTSVRVGYRYWRGNPDRVEETPWSAHPLCGCAVTAAAVLRAAG